MPELPDVTVYRERLHAFVVGHRVNGIRVLNPFVLRSVEPPLSSLVGTTITGVRTLGKRLVLEFEHGRFLVIHLMIAGRLRWQIGRAHV